MRSLFVLLSFFVAGAVGSCDYSSCDACVWKSDPSSKCGWCRSSSKTGYPACTLDTGCPDGVAWGGGCPATSAPTPAPPATSAPTPAPPPTPRPTPCVGLRLVDCVKNGKCGWCDSTQGCISMVDGSCPTSPPPTPNPAPVPAPKTCSAYTACTTCHAAQVPDTVGFCRWSHNKCSEDWEDLDRENDRPDCPVSIGLIIGIVGAGGGICFLFMIVVYFYQRPLRSRLVSDAEADRERMERWRLNRENSGGLEHGLYGSGFRRTPTPPPVVTAKRIITVEDIVQVGGVSKKVVRRIEVGVDSNGNEYQSIIGEEILNIN